MEKLFAVCTPGLESFTAQELHQLGLRSGDGSGSAYEPGGIEFEGSLHDAYRANLHLRTASRVLVRLGQFYAAEFPELRRKAGRLLWGNFFAPERSSVFRG